MTIKPQMTLQ